ncbi:Dbl homology domain-containing protein [Paraphysoderma sedebokerense]|nr:Dbl homology domain-containing protein [Paraphysoderma sedebokerense]
MVGDKRRSKTEEIQLSNEQPSQPTTSGFRLRSKTADISNSARMSSRISSPTPQSPTGDDTAKSRPSSQFFSSPDTLGSRSWVESMGGSEVVEKLNLSKADIKRQEVIYEMAKTEQDYVKDLDFVLETYITPLRKNKVVRAKDLAIIFSNWEQLLPVNQELLRSLESRRGQNKIVEQVGDIWLRISDYLKIYTMYCSNHPYALVRLEKVMGVKSFSKFCDACAALPESRSMNLASYLIKPVQRICKYPLLVKELIKQTPATHSDHQNLTQALSKIETVVTIVNEAARQTDAVHKMLKIQANFTSVRIHLIVHLKNTDIHIGTSFHRNIETKYCNSVAPIHHLKKFRSFGIR